MKAASLLPVVLEESEEIGVLVFLLPVSELIFY